jgi:predicted acetyltransferase
MRLKLEQVQRSRRRVIREMMQLYLYDFTYYLSIDLDDKGRFPEYPGLNQYWSQPGKKFPFLIYADSYIAGFALVDRLQDPLEGDYYMTEFFILKKYRRTGIGKWAAHQLFDRYRGKWKVTQVQTNRPAQLFWRQVIGEYTKEQYREMIHPEYGNPSQYFNTQQAE